jgi:hypothetical protein
MKRFLVVLVFSLICNFVFGQKFWFGGINDDWNEADNWSPAGVPTASDYLLFFSDANVISVPTQSIGGLFIPTAVNVSLQGSGTSLTIPTATLIGSLTLNNSLNIIMTNNFTVDVDGVLIMGPTNTIGGAGGFTLVNGGKIITPNVAGLNGSITTTSKSFSSDGIYEFNGTAGQVTGTLLPGLISGTLTISNTNPAGVTLSNDLTLEGTSHSISSNSKLVIPLGKNLKNNGAIAIDASASLSNLGTLSGTGTISGSFNNQAIISPGSSAGTVTITGNYTAQNTSTHIMELTSGGYDQINITGTANLNGVLNVTLGGSYEPNNGDNFKLFNYGSKTGTFSSVNLPAGYNWTLTYGATSVDLLFQGPLPIELSKFEANKRDKTVVLDWVTSSEENNDKFVIERSIDGKLFEKLNELKGAGNSLSTNYYNFIDENPLSGLNYYRLRQIDFDGKSSVSDLRMVKMEADLGITVSPTIVSDQLNIQLNQVVDKPYMINIISLGTGISINQISVKSGDLKSDIDVSSLSPGSYIAQLIIGNEVHNHVFIKQ